MSTTILVVDDNEMTRDLVKTYLEQESFRVVCAEDGRRGLDLARHITPDLIILDLMLPHIDGLDICRILRTESDVPIMMLTAKTTEVDVLLGIDLGADDYIRKPFSPRELVARVRMILRRYQKVRITDQENQLIEVGDLRIDFQRYAVYRDNEKIALTTSEFYLLGLMARHPGQVFSRANLQELIPAVGDKSLERTIDFHVMNLRRKIERDPGSPFYILTVYGVGYKFNDEAQTVVIS